jgi:hypothetical protein
VKPVTESQPDPVTDATAAMDEADTDVEEPLPSISEQVSQQLGGVRGLIESSIPVVMFVLANVIGGWIHVPDKLKVAVVVSVATALMIAVFRLSRRQPIRHAINGLFGIALGAWLALRSGDERDFYLPGILLAVGYGVALIASVLVKRPLVGWIWSVVMAGGSSQWRSEPKLVRTFGWLTLLWAAIYLVKAGIQAVLYSADMATMLGVVRIVLGYPPYLLLLAITVWAVRRARAETPAAELS